MHRLAALAWTLGAFCLVGCNGDETPPPGPTQDAAPTKEQTQAQRQENHRKAFSALLPTATEAMTLADPVAAAAIGHAPLRPPGFGLTELKAARAAHDRAAREAMDIDASLLEPESSIALQSIRFTLNRLNDRTTRRLPARTDATWTVSELRLMLDELDYRALRGDCSDCLGALELAGPALRTIPTELSAVSPAGLQAGIEDLEMIAVRLEGIGKRDERLTAAATQAAAAAREAKDLLAEQSNLLDSAPAHEWADPPPGRSGEGGTRRLPNRIGSRSLVRRLEVEEGISLPPERIFPAIKRNLARYQAMRAALEPSGAGKPRPVDKTRCERVWSELDTSVATQPGFTPGKMDCGRFVSLMAAKELDDADLVLALVDLGFIEPMRRGFRNTQPPTIALATGRIGPLSQRDVRRVMILSLTDESAALVRSLEVGQDALCSSATAVWIHGQLGEDAELTQWLTQHCPQHAPDEWITLAERRPRQSLAALGLATITDQPASMVGLDVFYWAPIGLIPLLATPPGESGTMQAGPPAAPESPIDIQIEELGG